MSFRYGVMNDEERRKKERTKSIFKRFNFLTLSKVSWTLIVVLHLDSKVLLVYGLFALLLTRLGMRAPIPYVQDAILNLVSLCIMRVVFGDVTNCGACC